MGLELVILFMNEAGVVARDRFGWLCPKINLPVAGGLYLQK